MRIIVRRVAKNNIKRYDVAPQKRKRIAFHYYYIFKPEMLYIFTHEVAATIDYILRRNLLASAGSEVLRKAARAAKQIERFTFLPIKMILEDIK